MIKDSINTIIDIAETIAPIISSRDIISILKNDIAKMRTEKIDLDFSKVDFVSRSASHELLSLKEELKRKTFKSKEVNFVNANDDVKKMFRTVAANKAIPEKSKPKFEAKVVSVNSLFNAVK